MKADDLIIGGGMAGAILALTLHRRGHRVILADDPARSRCTRVAAGMMNPVNFQSMAPVWNAAALVPFAHEFYAALNAEAGEPLFTRRRLVRVLSEAEAARWPADKPFFGSREENPFPGIVHAPHGVGLVSEAGQLSTEKLLQALRNPVLFPNIHVHETYFSAADLVLTNEAVCWGDITADRIIFCEGHLAAGNTLFAQLPLIPLKGQLLRIEATFATGDLISGAPDGKGGYLVPAAANRFIFGATHERDRTDETQTPEGRAQLGEKLQALLRIPYTVTGTVAGVRPTTRDHRPVIGRHHEQPRVLLFNGLGSKGTLQAPWLAEQLALFIDEQQPLPRLVDAGRFF